MNLTYSRVYGQEAWKTAGTLHRATDAARALAFYLMTAPAANPFGLYRNALPTMEHELKRPKEQIRKALAELTGLAFCQFDEESGWVWVQEMAAWQFRPLPVKPNNLVIRSARRWYANVPRNPFMGAWFDRYNAGFLLDDREAFAGTEVQRREWAGRLLPAAPAPTPAALPGLALEPPSTAIERRKTPTIAGQAEFETWWACYPRKEAKSPALAKWLSKKIPAANVPAMIAKLAEQARSQKWQEGFIPHATTYLNQERWNDETDTRASSQVGANKTNRATMNTLEDLGRELSPWDGDEQ